MMNNIYLSVDVLAFHHVGIRVGDLQTAEEFYQLLGFIRDPDECYPQYHSTGLVNQHGLHINLISNADGENQKNILVDIETKFSGITHLALLVDNLQDAMKFVQAQNIVITEGPMVLHKRKIFFIRDPDGNVIEFDQLNE
jgi:catechol 2,3-dioxygenase-like lactoylglutathione lyase family enzyme